jgi:hypothetical protein
MLTIPETIVTDLMMSVESVFNACSPLILLIFGVGLAFYVAQQIMNFLPHK